RAFSRGIHGTLTIDSDGNALGEDEAISTLESGDLAEGVELEVLLRDTLAGLALVDDLDIETVGLRNGEEDRSAGVALQTRTAYVSYQSFSQYRSAFSSGKSERGLSLKRKRIVSNIPRRSRSFRRTFWI